MGSSVRVAAVGDIMVKRAEPESMFEPAAPVLQAADITFGNCESAYSTRGSRNPAVMGEVCAHPSNIKGLAYAGFNVMSLANNHFLDAGYDALFDTINGLRDCGIGTCGAGANIMEAREPAIIDSSLGSLRRRRSPDVRRSLFTRSISRYTSNNRDRIPRS